MYMAPKSKNYVTTCCNIIQCLKYHKTPPILIMLKVMNTNSRDSKRRVLGQTTTFLPLLWCTDAVNGN